ncbi:MAG: hypothetical protein ACTHMC_24980 [Pseudobacter sp.]|uniref:hypothetical protein n=1 Tax=Pseudobacter sp. TaxID=2045420 RepID=UPI003F8209C7
MERRILFAFSCVFLLCGLNSVGSEVLDTPARNVQYGDSVVLPECIKKLTAPPAKGVRASLGAKQFRHTYLLKNGNTLYVLHSKPSIGCHINEPASTKYYNDSCKLVASFPTKFSIKQGFKPYVADGYKPEDFPEAAQGDYPAYFQKQQKAGTENRIIISDARAKDPFPVERKFSITAVEDDVLNWKRGDVISISTKSGLKHYRNNKLLNNYKIVPQLTTTKTEAQCRVPPCFTTITNVLVYHMDGIRRFVEIRNNGFMISSSEYADAPSPTKNIDLTWKRAYTVSAK